MPPSSVVTWPCHRPNTWWTSVATTSARTLACRSCRGLSVRSSDPFALKENHQVLAYGYDLEGTELTLRLYDPNHPRNDEVTLSLSLANPSARTAVRMSPAGRPVLAFFRVPYRPASPP